ncbi:MAG: TauD/TfdA family dioxygenase [Alphaproteobacteria bacterium]|nr:TauD/TfdA family dioxygenase [Alphaproteobacteria bacterium]
MRETTPNLRPAAHWRAADLVGGVDALAPPPLPGLVERLDRLAALDIPIGDPVPIAMLEDCGLGPDIALWREGLFEGTGVVVIRGLPVDRWGEDRARRVFWGLGHGLGKPVSQSRMGDRLGDITRVSDDPNQRGYRSGRALSMHTDSDDVVGMFCLRPGASGGRSRLVSVHAIRALLAREAPETLAPLETGFRYHWRGEEPAGEPPITEYRIPILGRGPGGDLQTCFLLNHLEQGHAATEPMTEAERQALDRFIAATEDPDLRLDYDLARGDMVFIDNLNLLHGRTAFEDTPDNRRLLLRLWLVADPARPRHPSIARFYGDGGIEEVENGDTLLRG